MLRFSAYWGLLATTLFVSLWGLGRLADRRPSDDLNVARITVASQQTNLDYLFVGSSYTYSAVDPHQLTAAGLAAYNLGTPSAGPAYYELLLEDCLEALGSQPRHIVFEVSPLVFSPRSDRWADYPIHRRLTSPRSHEHVALRFRALREYPSMLVNSARKILASPADPAGVAQAMAEAREQHGYLPSDAVFSERILKTNRHLYEPFRDAGFSETKRERLEAVLLRTTDAGSRVLLLEIPTFRLSEFFSSEHLRRYRETIANLESQGYRVLRIPTPPAAAGYRNIDHMNSRTASPAAKRSPAAANH